MVYVGTASWTDPGFIADWYPPKMRREDLLPYYSEHFNLVEVNSTFYALQRAETVDKWCHQTPKDFKFDFKLPGIFSFHKMDWARLPKSIKEKGQPGPRGKVERTDEVVEAMLEATQYMLQPAAEAGKLGAVLLQLSPSFSPKTNNLEELNLVIDNLGYQVAVEFRNKYWFEDEQAEKTMNYLADHNATYVNLDAPKGENFIMLPDMNAVTSPKLAYLRLHGRNAEGFVHGRSVAERFNYKYSKDELKEIRDRVNNLQKEATDVHAVFNNNYSNLAPVAASELNELLN